MFAVKKKKKIIIINSSFCCKYLSHDFMLLYLFSGNQNYVYPRKCYDLPSAMQKVLNNHLVGASWLEPFLWMKVGTIKNPGTGTGR